MAKSSSSVRATVWRTVTATLLWSSAVQAASLELSDAVGVRGGRAVIYGVLHDPGEQVVGAQLDLVLSAGLSAPPNERGQPPCKSFCNSGYRPSSAAAAAFSATLDDDPVGGPAKECTSIFFSYIPRGCTPGVDCTGIRYLELSLSSTDPFPPDATLFACTLSIDGDADLGSHGLTCSNPQTANTEGQPVATTCSGATVDIVCPGDCDRDGHVTVAELVRGFGIIAGETPLSTCTALDVDTSASVTIGELVRARKSLLGGCGR